MRIGRSAVKRSLREVRYTTPLLSPAVEQHETRSVIYRDHGAPASRTTVALQVGARLLRYDVRRFGDKTGVMHLEESRQ